MKQRFFLLWLIILFYLPLHSQDKNYAKSIIDTLASPSMHGRGYVNNGDKIASTFISEEFKKDNLKSFGTNYFQTFHLPVCTLPGKVTVKIGDNTLSPGVDYLVSPSSPTTKGTYSIIKIDSQVVCNKKKFNKILKSDFSKKFIFLNRKGVSDKNILAQLDEIEYKNSLKTIGIITVSDKLIWGGEDALTPSNTVNIAIKKSSLPSTLKEISVDISQEKQPSHEFNNIIAYVEGKTKPDSFIVFTAHYDHLGQMGSDIYFPGANDNASGTAMVLDLAKYYSKNQPDYSVAFISMCGEELGLIGSTYYVSHPLFPLSKIRFLINLDMEGTGDDGIKVVNGTIMKKEFDLLSKINDEKKYLPSVNIRGEAANSDHYPFYEKGVKDIFIYTLGGIAEYHNIFDKAKTLPLTKYNELFKLLTDFVQALNN
jgi:aminopeptidase YwaD